MLHCRSCQVKLFEPEREAEMALHYLESIEVIVGLG